MSAGEALRMALVAAFAAEPALAGVAVTARPAGIGGEGAARGMLPRIEIAEAAASDWGAKGLRGRELRSAVVVRTAASQDARIAALTAAIERAGESLAGDIGGWRVASATFVRARAVGSERERAMLIEHRFRMIEED